jgi:D-alanine-D-alanine ligase-like ATP-grasp enzyme
MPHSPVRLKNKRSFYDRDWKNLHVTSDCPASDREIERPANLDEMLRIAERLSKDFPYVRVDLYNVDGKIYFGELTFYPWSGYVQYTPDEADYKFGENFNLVPYKM